MNPSNNFEYGAEKEYSETVVSINRVSKKTKGGNQMRFSALVVVGNKDGKVGAAVSKAKDVRGAIQKAMGSAKRHLIEVPRRGTTIPFEVNIKYGAAKVMLKPAPPGSGIIAGGTIRMVLEAAGIHDAVGKTLGTNNKISNVYATLEALKALAKIQTRRARPTKEEKENE